MLLDGEPVRSCLVLAASVDGHEITTVEGLAEPDGTLSPVQQAFRECHGLQCGFCTSGFLTTVTAWLAHNPAPTRAQAREAIVRQLEGYRRPLSCTSTACARRAACHAGKPGAAT